jgi:hypothetical protein
MTTVYTVIEYSDRRKEFSVQILGTFTNLQNAHELVNKYYLQEIENTREEYEESDDPLPDWINNPQILIQHKTQYAWGISGPKPVYEIVFPGDKGIAIVQTILQ